MTRDQAKASIQNLVERFAEHRKEYHLPDYNEQKARQDFINPFFKALGWDIDNEKGASEAYREVIYEDKVVVRGKAKAPDYGFRLSGSGKKRLFFVEAKKPSVPLKTNKESAYQLKRYGSSAQAHVSILTNFEDFIVYDCSRVPNLNDSASVSRLKHINFEDYIKEFDFLYDTFSHEAVTKGRFDKFVQSDANKKGTDTLDKRFVKSLDEWRLYLAKSIAFNNRKLTDEEINFSVQQTLDRLIFMRFCEDRAVEPDSQLQKAVSKGDSYKNLLDIFRLADDKYNSGLFDFKKDVITPKLKIDNRVLKIVINELYFPLCNFDFRVMPVEVLGNAYEQFLGKVIRTTPARSVKIEEKPEVRKAGGVFYTPQYIVEYIVKKTVGKLIDGKSPKEIEKIKIVDPACGSGSFLVGAYQYLLDFHLDYYYNEQKRLTQILESKNIALKEKNKTINDRGILPLTPDGKLTTKIKKQILVNNIFGVDIDANAVEVTKLSLLLKCMEGETQASINTITLNDRVLPNIDHNIKDGNSLIDTDFYDNQIDLGYEQKIKPFSWKKGFPEIFKQGGFDAVIGNPPFIQLSSYSETTDAEKKYLLSKYKSSMGRLNTFGFFTKKGIDLINEKCYLGFIIPNTITTQDYYEELREMILSSCSIDAIVNFDKLPFKDAVVENVILILQKTQSNKERDNTKTSIVQVDDRASFVELKKIKQSLFSDSPKQSFNTNINAEGNILKSKIIKGTKRLGDFFEVNQAIALRSDRSKWVSDKKKGNNYKPLLVGGKNINRYSLEWDGTYLKYDLEGIHSCKREDIFLSPEKLFFRRVANKLIGTLDTKKFYGLHTLVVMNLKFGVKENIRFFLGIFNSTLLTYYYNTTFASSKTVFSEIGARQVQELPIKYIDFKNQNEKQIHNEIVKHVDSLLKLNEEIKTEKLQTKIDQIKSRIEHSEEKINELVYGLYNLTAEEIKIIEGGGDE